MILFSWIFLICFSVYTAQAATFTGEIESLINNSTGHYLVFDSVGYIISDSSMENLINNSYIQGLNITFETNTLDEIISFKTNSISGFAVGTFSSIASFMLGTFACIALISGIKIRWW